MRLSGTPVLHTRRLLLRRYCAADAEAAFSLWSKEHWDQTLTAFPPHDSIQDTERQIGEWIDAYQSPNVLRWAICNNDGFIGDIAVTRWQPQHNSCELAFALSSSARRKGYMQEALCAVVRYLTETVQFHRVMLKILTENSASVQLAERAGFQLEGTLRDAFLCCDGHYSDILVYARIASNVSFDSHQILKEN